MAWCVSFFLFFLVCLFGAHTFESPSDPFLFRSNGQWGAVDVAKHTVTLLCYMATVRDPKCINKIVRQ